jgi:prepilin-type N-terminal cleavage/methylation domain-containing protein
MHSLTNKTSRSRGFTIVELLIVIVVIAILAAISIVAYNGIQERGRNAKTASATKQYITALNLYAVDNSSYPGMRACIGDGYTYNGTAGVCGGETGISTNATFDAALSKYLPQKPILNTKYVTIRTNTYRAGGYYDPGVGTYGVVYYLLEGTSGGCDAGGTKSLSADAGVTGYFCTYYLPAP